MIKIFISYRRSDAQGEAGRLYDALIRFFSPSDVFMDVDSLLLGRDFPEALDKALDQTNIMLVVIGPEWLKILKERLLGEELDYVRKEIATGLARDIPVVPVLVRGANVPKPKDLPEDLYFLPGRHAIDIHHDGFANDVNRLVEKIRLQEIGFEKIKKASEPDQQQKSPSLDLGLTVAQEYNKSLEFVDGIEVDFSQMLDLNKYEWFYNPHPYSDLPRFIVRGFPDLDDRFYRLEILEEVEDEEHYSEISKLFPVIIAFPDGPAKYDDLRDYALQLVDNGEWSELQYVRCEACGTLQFDEQVVPTSKDDLTDYDGEMYEEWCPHCETSCERCGRTTSKGGWCNNCQADLEHFMDRD